MTEYEVLEMLSLLRSETGDHVTNFVGVLFGYLATAYFIGSKLSSIQLAAINFTYFVYVPGPLLASFESSSTITKLFTSYPEYAEVSENSYIFNSHLPELVPLMIVAAWIVSLLFMVQIRNNERKTVAPANKNES